MSKMSDNNAMRIELEGQLGEATKKFHFHMEWYKKHKRDIANIEKKLWLLAKEEKAKNRP